MENNQSSLSQETKTTSNNFLSTLTPSSIVFSFIAVAVTLTVCITAAQGHPSDLINQAFWAVLGAVFGITNPIRVA